VRTGFIPPPRAIRKARLDNLAIVKGSLLPFKKQWQQLANQQPEGTMLIVLPLADTPYRRRLRELAKRMMANGRRIKILAYAADKP
jgi:hypothetical protein